MSKNISDQLVETLVEAGIRRIYMVLNTELECVNQDPVRNVTPSTMETSNIAPAYLNEILGSYAQLAAMEEFIADIGSAGDETSSPTGWCNWWGYAYSAALSSSRPPKDYTERLKPYIDGVAVPLEEERILWQL